MTAMPMWVKTPIAAGLFALLALSLRPQELQHFVGVMNVEVPVRVFDGGRFVDDLTLADFEITENGTPQMPVGLYLIKKTGIRKEEAGGAALPPRPAAPMRRTIILEFELMDPLPKVDEAMDYFCDEVLQPEDSLIVITPRTTYRFKPEALAKIPRPEIARQLKGKLRSDVLAGAAEFKRIQSNILDVSRMPVDPDLKMQLFQEYLRLLRDRIGVPVAAIQQLAKTLKTIEGQKFVFLFYEKEVAYVPNMGNFGDESLPNEEMFLSDAAQADTTRLPSASPRAIEQAFADAAITAHFIYLTQPGTNAGALGMEYMAPLEGGALEKRDMSASIFGALQDVARATGGITESSGNAAAAFRTAVAASENYYLLYYVPANYKADGTFREIKVAVKGKSYRVTHRAGYFAN